MDLIDKTILVTGGAGFVGSHVVDLLLKEKVKKIIVLDNFHRGTPKNLIHLKGNKKIIIKKGDIRNRALVNRIVKECNAICHQAAIRLTKCAEDPRLCHEVMIDGTFNILEAARTYNIEKIVMASSVSVYGEPSYVPIDENHPYNNTTAYGAAKIANEHMAKAFHSMYGIPIVLLRYFNVYGPRMDIYGAYTEVLIKWLEKIDMKESPIIHGDGKQALDFVFVGDVARANIHAFKKSIDFGIYNIGTGRQTSLKELIHKMILITCSDVKPVFQSDVKRPYVQNRLADVTLAKKDLGFISNVSIDEGLKKLIEWRQKTLLSI